MAHPATREQRRRRTEAAILCAARELFAELGFERTTIRAVAGRAGVDPALVMQHYGSKEGLFAAAARWGEDAQQVLDAPPEQVPAAALADFFARFEGGERDAMIALMRSCLTHPGAAAVVRDQVMAEHLGALSRAAQGDDAELRASVFAAGMMGLGLARYLLAVEPLASAPREDVERVLLPALHALLGTSAPDPAP